jgi:hypothetical protein
LKNWNRLSNHATRRIIPAACATALAMAFTAALSQPAFAGQVTPPSVPADIEVPAWNKAFLVGHADGTQNYVCRPSAASPSGVGYVLFTPQATLFNDDDRQLITTSSAPTPTRLTLTRVQRWWPMARFAPRGSTRGTRARSGPRCTNPLDVPLERSLSTGLRLTGSCSMWLEP